MDEGATSGELSGQPILTLLDSVTESMTNLKALLESNNILDLESALFTLQDVLKSLATSYGDLEGLNRAITSLPTEQRKLCNERLEKIKQLQEINSGLIALATQRNAALQAYSAQTRPEATYSSAGGVAVPSTGDLLGKF
jgi:uncharacterized phage infection (PIP) family protein YhgE